MFRDFGHFVLGLGIFEIPLGVVRKRKNLVFGKFLIRGEGGGVEKDGF
jgi:hypothetical protein